MGFGPFAAMSDIHIIQGKPVVGANLMAAAVKSHPRYDYRVTANTPTEVTIEYYQEGKSIGRSTFTMDDAKAAGINGKDNWKKYPRNMLFARAMSNGVRWYCPDVFSGAAVYVPDEFDIEVEPVAITEVKEESMTQEDFDKEPDIPFDDKQEPPEPQSVEGGNTWTPDQMKKFWIWCGQQGLDKPIVHEALKVKSVNDYTGTVGDAKTILNKLK